MLDRIDNLSIYDIEEVRYNIELIKSGKPIEVPRFTDEVDFLKDIIAVLLSGV